MKIKINKKTTMILINKTKIARVWAIFWLEKMKNFELLRRLLALSLILNNLKEDPNLTLLS